MTEEVIEFRCPNGPGDKSRPDGTCSPGKLFAQLRMSGERPSFIHPDNLIVMACGDCKRFHRKAGRHYFRVLHCYDLAGTFIKTLYEDDPGDESGSQAAQAGQPR